jgi:hypothetical protein
MPVVPVEAVAAVAVVQGLDASTGLLALSMPENSNAAHAIAWVAVPIVIVHDVSASTAGFRYTAIRMFTGVAGLISSNPDGTVVKSIPP